MATNDLSKAGHNFTCFAKVCVDLMKLPLIDVLKLFIKPQDLHTNIQNSSLTTGKNKLRQDQLKICFIPPPGKPNYNDFDVTLLYTLTRNLCPLLTPTQGWGIEPRTTDTLIGDDIERLRLFRNNYYGHADSTEISDVEFEDLWKHVKSTIRRIGNYTNSSYEQEFNKIEMCRFGYHDLEKYKLLLEAALEFSKQLNNKDKTDISIKGENEVICGKIARFLVDVNPAERPNSLVTWQKVRGRVIEQIDTSREKYRGSYDRQLVINSVCKEDEGEYQAVLSQLSNGMKKTFSNLIFLFPLGEPPCFDVWKVTTSSEEITINYSYVVPESSPKVQKIQWSRDGTILNLKNTKYDGGGLTDSSLTIMSPNEEDKGNYSCTVSNAVGSVTNNLMFDVPKAKLKLSTEFSKDEVFFGSKVILNSEVSSCPSLDGVKWQASIDAENFTCIDIGEQRYVGSQDNPECPLLVIPKITFEDIFYYRLLVWNKIGKGASNSLRLNVTGSPPNVLTNHEIYIEDQSVRMIGKVFVNKMLPAIKTIYWTKDGKKLEMEDGGEKYSEVNTRNPSLTIRNVNQHDAGTYRLTATNAVGTTSSEIVLDLPSICVERSENPDGSQTFTAIIDSVPAAYRAQWNVKDTDDETFTPIDVNAEVYKGTSNSLPCPVLVVKQKKLSENKCFQIEVYNFVGRSITKISGNVSLAVLDTQRTAEGDISSYVFNTNGSTVRFNDLRRNLIKGLRSTDLQELKDSLEGLTRERKLFRNVKTISEFFRQLLDEGIFKERDVVILQYLMRAINRPDLEEMCIEYARKDHQALCYFEDPKVREKPKVYLHVVDDMEKYRSLDSLLQTVACIIGCTSKDIEIVGVRPDSSFIIIVALRMDLLNILKDASPLNLTKLVRYNVDWIQIEDKIVNINYPISKAVRNKRFVSEVMEHLEPSDVLDHFPFLSEEEVNIIEQLERAGLKKEACMKFLTVILHREDKKEVQENEYKLINAFREEGYQRLVDSYENTDNEDEVADEDFMEFLIKMTKAELMNEIDAGPLISILLAKGYIKVKDQQYLNFLHVRDMSEACRELVRRMKKHKHWAAALFDALNETQPELLTKIDPGATNDELVQIGLEAALESSPTSSTESDSEEGYTSDLEKYDKEESEKTMKRKEVPEMRLRPYQLELAESAISGHNTIVCAHTGTGKTCVALHITKEHLLKNPEGCVVFLARTNALVEKRFALFEKYIPDKKIYHLHTATKECLRMNLVFEDHHVFFLTPQILLYNINNKQISLSDVSLLIFDECHHTRKREPYNNVMKQYLTMKRKEKKVPQVVGLTATLGVGDSTTESGALQHMLKLCANLDVYDISTVTKNIEDFRKHVAVPKRETIKMGKNEKDPLKIIILDNIARIEAYISTTEVNNTNKLKRMWQKKPNQKEGKHYQRWTVHFRNKVSCKLRNNKQLVREVHAAMTHLAAYNEALDVNYLMNKNHVIEHLQRKFEHDFKTIDTASKKEKEFLQMIIEFCYKAGEIKVEMNPYLRLMREKMVEFVGEYEEVKGIVFIQTRATAFALAQYLSQELALLGIRAAPVTGTNSSETSKGMPDAQKNETLDNFRKGDVNVLVATSVGSEGIDVPDCNFIITYNYTGNEASVIQMSGRARRHGSTVAHISDQTIQRREEVSLQKARLMDEAFRRLYMMHPDDRMGKILKYQSEIRNVDDPLSVDEASKAKKPFQLICFKCHAEAVSNTDLRLYVGQHRVVTNPDFQSRCEFDTNTTPSRYTISIIRCTKCKLKWGTTFKIEKLEIPVLKVTAFLFTTGGEEPHRFKKWGKVSLHIESIDKQELLNINKDTPELEEPDD